MGLRDFFNVFRKKRPEPVKRKVRVKRKKKSDPKIKEAFEKVKRDIELQAGEIERHQNILNEHSNLLNKHDSEIRGLVTQISELQMLKQSLSLRPIQDQSKTAESKSKSKTAVKMIEIAERNILKNMKKIIKNEIFKIIERESMIPVSRLKTIICEEKQFCSRASFFNYMKELKRDGLIENETIDGQRVTNIKKKSKKEEKEIEETV